MPHSRPAVPPVPGTPAREAVASLLELHGDRLYRLALRLCPTETEAEDLVQETMIAALQAWPRFRGESRTYTWLFRIAARTCGRMQRKRSGEPDRLLPLDEILGMDRGGRGPASADAASAATAASGPDAVARQELRARLDRALAGVPASFRMALVLKDIADFSLDEIGRILEIPTPTAKTRVHRGRVHLRRVLEEEGVFPGLPASDTPRQVCLDLLAAKLEAMDRGVEFPLPPGEICDRCSALFTSLDLAFDACATLRDGAMTDRLRTRLAALLRER